MDKFGGFDGAPPLFFNTFSSGWEEFSPRNLPGLGAIHEARSSSWKRIFESSTLGRRPFIVGRISAGETFPRLKLGRSFACGIASLYICTGVYKEGGGRINRSDLDGNRGMSIRREESFVVSFMERGSQETKRWNLISVNDFVRPANFNLIDATIICDKGKILE